MFEYAILAKSELVEKYLIFGVIPVFLLILRALKLANRGRWK